MSSHQIGKIGLIVGLLLALLSAPIAQTVGACDCQSHRQTAVVTHDECGGEHQPDSFDCVKSGCGCAKNAPAPTAAIDKKKVGASDFQQLIFNARFDFSSTPQIVAAAFFDHEIHFPARSDLALIRPRAPPILSASNR